MKKILKWSFLTFLFMTISVIICNFLVIRTSEGKLFENVDSIPQRKVALVLGTKKNLHHTYVNPYFESRIESAAELYHKKKVQHFILSGDNGSPNYDEPNDMKESLINLGVPAFAITLDYAGFRTLDSVIRCKEVFQQTSIIIVSQEFHNYRAIFLANKIGLDAIGLNAKKVWIHNKSKVGYREYLARVKAVFDIVIKKEPKYLGEKIVLPI